MHACENDRSPTRLSCKQLREQLGAVLCLISISSKNESSSIELHPRLAAASRRYDCNI